MPFDPAGNASLPPETWASPGQTIRVEQHNPAFRDVEAMLSNVLKRDGRDGMVGPLGMGGFPIQGVGTSTNAADAAVVGQLAPIGVVLDFAGSSAPAGWLLCYGQAVSRTTYADLFAVVGTTFGTGDGGTTFNLPDGRDVVTVGRGNMGGTARGLLSKFASTTLGAMFGVQEHALTLAQMAKHKHTATSAVTDPGHDHELTIRPADDNSSAGSNSRVRRDTSSLLRTKSATTGITVATTLADAGGDEAHPNVQPTMVMNKIIRATY